MEDFEAIEAAHRKATGKRLIYGASVILIFLVAALSLFLGHVADDVAIETPADVAAAQAAHQAAPAEANPQ